MATMQYASEFVNQYLSDIGRCKILSQFGTKAIFIDDHVVGHMRGDKLYVRECEENKESLRSFGGEQYTYRKGAKNAKTSTNYAKNVHTVHTHYFHVPERHWGTEQFNRVIREAHEDAKSRKVEQSGKQVHRKLEGSSGLKIRDAFNLNKSHETQFKNSGIDSFEEVVKMGSVEAYKTLCRARKMSPLPVNRKLLWQLEGAIQRVHWCVLSDETKETLLNHISSS